MAPKTETSSGSLGTSIRLPGALREKIDTLAAQERRTRASMIKNLIEDGLTARERASQPPILEQFTGRKRRDTLVQTNQT